VGHRSGRSGIEVGACVAVGVEVAIEVPVEVAVEVAIEAEIVSRLSRHKMAECVTWYIRNWPLYSNKKRDL
jgi:hypothetical protein